MRNAERGMKEVDCSELMVDRRTPKGFVFNGRKRLQRMGDAIQFRNGYATRAPEMLVEFRGLRRYGKGRNAYYAIQLGRILKIKRWKT